MNHKSKILEDRNELKRVGFRLRHGEETDGLI